MLAKTKKQRGATMVEYAIVLASIAIVVAVIVGLIGMSLNDRYKDASDCVGGMAAGKGAADCPNPQGK